ncbi:transcriptional regulator [Halorubrum sp. BOL3-1]|nr:transcriptional regulator [Halorubrum sp. BOL3-1]
MNVPFVSGTGGGSSGGENELSRDDLFDLLSNRRRRFALHALKRMEEPIELAELSTYVAAWEMEMEPEEIDSEDRRSVHVTLRRTHLPKLAEKNILKFNESENTIRSTDALDNIEVHIEALHRNEIPWSIYYFGLAGVCGLLLVAVITEVPIFSTFTPLHVGWFSALIFGLSAVVHRFVGPHSQLGVSEKPPELQQLK